jgi:hypothetical protein
MGAALAALLLATHAAAADCSNAAIAGTPVKGMVKGHAFVPTDIHVDFTKDGMEVNGSKFDRYVLALDAGDIFNEFTLDMLVPLGKPVDGRIYRLVPGGIYKQRMAAEGAPEIQGWDIEFKAADVNTNLGLTEATLRIEWGKKTGDTIPGKLIFCAPEIGMMIAGTFTAKLR